MLADGSLDLYYERTGSGPPLVLLHGALGTIESCFAELRPRLSRRFEVIAIELEGHGRTGVLDRPFSYTQMANDVASLLNRLGIAPVHLAGYSIGGAVGMELALTRPHMVNRLVQFGGVSYSPAGDQPTPEPEVPDNTASDDAHEALLEGSRWHHAYQAVAPDPEQWPRLVEKITAIDTDFGWTPDQVASLTRPTLLINGDADVTTSEHVVEMFRHLGGGNAGHPDPPSPHQLAILPGTTHVGMLDQVDLLESMITTFLNGPSTTTAPATARPPMP